MYELLELDQVNPYEPKKKETNLYKVTLHTRSGKKPYFLNVSEEDMQAIQIGFIHASYLGGSFKVRCRGGFDIFNAEQIEYITVREQDGRENGYNNY